MLKSGLFSTVALFFAISVFVLALPRPMQKSPWRGQAEPNDPAYIRRGNEIQTEFQSYSDSLADYFQRLSAALQSDAPELVAAVRAPEEKAPGYRILPRWTRDNDPKTTALMHSGYSWPWTERLIRGARDRLADLEMQLRLSQALDSARRRAALEQLARDYPEVSDNLANLEAHVQYNRFWQSVIAADRARYDDETLLYRDVVTREQVRDELRYFDHVVGNAPLALQSALGMLSFAAFRRSLQEREALLSKRIDSALGPITTPPFVTLERRAHEWIFRVPLYTDIEDRIFVAAAKRMIEGFWHRTENGNTYRVAIDVSFLPTDVLYAESKKPTPGKPLDLTKHLRHFPADAAILTTGALTTHVETNAVVLGPQAISPRVLAHEFGHILGFKDRYIRGYRDLGKDGFEVLEAIADPHDIMGVPATGAVLAAHFHSLIQAISRAQQ
ncbi:MAG TPA: hypothetical protein VGH22_23085 [Candidatus Binatia bacterium]|jgi:hypothetical protein